MRNTVLFLFALVAIFSHSVSWARDLNQETCDYTMAKAQNCNDLVDAESDLDGWLSCLDDEAQGDNSVHDAAANCPSGSTIVFNPYSNRWECSGGC